MALAFSSNDQAVIDRKAEIPAAAVARTPDKDLEEKYELRRCTEWINKHQYKTVALQFPDEMLVDSVRVTLAIQKAVAADLYILGDTSYGSCCIDEVAAEHVKADALVHFGHTCLSYPSRLPVCFIFGNEPCPLHRLEEGLRLTFRSQETKIIVVFDVQYDHAKESTVAILRSIFRDVVVSELVVPETTDPRAEHDEIRKCARRIVLPPSENVEDYNILFVGPENRTLSNLVLTFGRCRCYSFDPRTQVVRMESAGVNKHLARRYHMIERVKDASVIGILVGTLGVRDYLLAIEHLKHLIEASGKKSYTLAMGKLNVAKLANFQEVDVYVLVACPENTLLDSKEFFRPVVTPFELEMALNASREWTGDYTANYGDILPGGSLHIDRKETRDASYDVSLVTGRIRRLGTREPAKGTVNGRALATKVGTVAVPSLHAGGAGEYLMRRAWQGLEPVVGDVPAAEITQGKSGLAAGYEGEGGSPT